MKPNCRWLEDRLEAFLDGTLPDEQRRAAESHLRGCARCGELRALLRGDLPDLEPEVPADLATSIFARTSGSPCARAESLVCDYVDGTLDEVERELMRLHLGTCEGCAGLVAATAVLGEHLPAMRSLTPDDRFVADVLAATSAAPDRRRQLGQRIARALDTLLRRPRIAWEAGYAGAMLVWLVVGFAAPTSLSTARAPAIPNPVDAVTRTVQPVSDTVAEFGQSVWVAGKTKTTHLAKGVGRAVTERTRRADEATRDLRRHSVELAEAALHLDREAGIRAADGLRNELKDWWQTIQSDSESADEALLDLDTE